MAAPSAIAEGTYAPHQSHGSSEFADGARRRRVVVVGAGISGLTAAYTLLKESQSQALPLDVVILESTARAGGLIRSMRSRSCIVECGPEAFLTLKPHAVDLCFELGLKERMIGTAAMDRRTFVGYKKQLHPLPDGFMLFAPTRLMPLATSQLFSVSGKLRMALDLILPRGEWKSDESLSQFVIRRLGREALERIAEPMIGGIYGGNPEQLSARSTAGRLIEIEHQYGSLIRGLWQEQRSRRKANGMSATNCSESGPRYGQMATVDTGMSAIIDSLLAHLPPDCLVLNKPVEKIRERMWGSNWDVVCSDHTVLAADAVILAMPATQAARLLAEVSPTLSQKLSEIKYAPATIVNLLYERKHIPHKLNGFGFVVPKIENTRLRACTFSSIKFANRAPLDQVLLRAFVPGEARENNLEQLVCEDLQTYLNISASPLSIITTRHDTAIPQYAVGHDEIVRDITSAVKRLPQLALAGNAYSGVGIPDCIASGKSAARTICVELFGHCQHA